MKKRLLVLSVAVLSCFFATAQITDTIVSLEPSKKNVLYEELTGVNCQFCPCGHKIANQVANANPGRVFVINVHAGGYAANYTTQYGSAIDNLVNPGGYPSGTVNRHAFSGSSIKIPNYSNFANYANQIMNMSSPVNMAAEATLDWPTRTLSIRLQIYYTAEQTVSSNALNIAVVQDNVIGPQVINQQSCAYPEMMVGSQYRHMHMFRHFITGQWGETISDITPGVVIEKNFEYVIPNTYGTGVGTSTVVPAKLEDLHFIAFIAQGQKEVLTAIDIPVEIVNRPAADARVLSIVENGVGNCEGKSNAVVTFENAGTSDNLTSLEYKYSVGENEYTGSWTGDLTPMSGTSTVELDNFEFPMNSNNVLYFEVTSINGEPITTTPFPYNIKTKGEAAGYMYFKIVTDRYADETTFKVFNPDGTVLLQGGPWNQAIQTRTFDIKPTMTGCHRLEVYDQYGDGINAGYGAGYFEVWNSNNDVIIHDDGAFGSKAVYYINVTEPYAVEDHSAENVSIYPNPATDNITISGAANLIRAEIFNIQGQLVKAENETGVISVKDLSNGVYMLKVTTDNGSTMHKFVKK